MITITEINFDQFAGFFFTWVLIDNGDKFVFSLHEFVMKMTKISETKQAEKRRERDEKADK